MIITTDIDVLIFPKWLYGRIRRYTRRQALLDPIRDVENERIVGAQFSRDPDFEELRNTDFKNASVTKKMIEWSSTKKFKFDDEDIII